MTWDDSRVYTDLTLGRYYTIKTYGLKGYEDIPFIKAGDYARILFKGRERISAEDNVYKIAVNGTEVLIDPEADTIWFENAAKIRSVGDVDGAVIEEEEFDIITMSVKNKSVQTEIPPLTISLKDYHMPVIAYEDDILMPFLALQNTIGVMSYNNYLAYNGKDYYNAFEADNFVTDQKHANAKDSPYIKAIYSGPFSKKNQTTQAYADYGYYSVCLLLDLTFGHKEELNITTFDDYFTRMNARKSMTSTDPSAATIAEIMLFNYLFGTGHDSMMNMDTVFAKSNKSVETIANEVADDLQDSKEGETLFEEQSETDPEQAAMATDAIIGALLGRGFNLPDFVSLVAWNGFFESIKPEEYGTERLDYVDDTAVIYFSSFKNDYKRDPSYYLDPINEEDVSKSNFAFFYNCFEDIKKHDGVKNVVINLCDNGGGAAAGLISILGFLSKDGEVRFSDRDILAGNYREECYHVDTNLDGIADDNDGYGGQYDFFILSSNLSYSCANALPYFAQKDGLATIIGTAPGGGDCVVGYFVDAYGRCAFYSGYLQLGRDDGTGFVSNEKDTHPDFNLMPSILDRGNVPWFDPAGITEVVHQYKSGVREIVYDNKTQEEKVSEFINGLFERLAESLGQMTEGAN